MMVTALHRARSLALCGAFVACAALACQRADDGPRAVPVAPVLVVGVDGLEWDVLRPLIAQGSCPNLRALMERGAFGRCETLLPTFSPILWTSIATAKRMPQHGIESFVHDCGDGRQCPYTSSERHGRALWNIADRYGLTTNVFGWWITWPVEEIRGVMVSGSSSDALFDENWKPALLPDIDRQVHPQELEARVLEVAARAGAPERVREVAEGRLFAGVAGEDLGPVERNLVRQTAWSIQADLTFAAVARAIVPEHPADLTMIYFGTPDVVGHRFWRYREPDLFRWPHGDEARARWRREKPDEPPLEELLANADGERALAGVVSAAYVWFDEQLGQLVELVGDETTVIVVSDHGMHAEFTDFPDPLQRWNSGHHLDGPPGVIVAAGPGIRRRDGLVPFLAGDDPPVLASVLSVAPTVMALLGIPTARAFDRRPEVPLLEGRALQNASLPQVDTHDDGFRVPRPDALPEGVRASFVERFGDLGYLGGEDDED